MNELILIVDDEPALFEAVATALGVNGYQCRIAEDGRQALTAIEAQRPALMLLDLHMPVLDGESVLRELAVRGIELPIVLMSGDDAAQEVARRYGAGVYLSKPIDIPRLLAAVAACSPRPDGQTEAA